MKKNLRDSIYAYCKLFGHIYSVDNEYFTVCEVVGVADLRLIFYMAQPLQLNRIMSFLVPPHALARSVCVTESVIICIEIIQLRIQIGSFTNTLSANSLFVFLS